jgi:FkbM family methyltransferase
VREFISARPFCEALYVRKRLCALEAREKLRESGRKSALPVEFTSQYGEDCFLWDLFGGQLEGFFIEVGAFDGYTFSVTYPFEAIGWRGLLVEPIPEMFEAARARRPGSRVVHSALSATGSQDSCTFTVVEGERFGMLSYLHQTPVNMADVKSTGAPSRAVTVPMTSMNALLEGHEGRIDFAVLDVEGGEVELLKGFDLERFRPRVLLVEEGLPAPTSPVMQYLSRFPYTPTNYAWINRVYIRNDEPELLRQAARVAVW